MKKLLLFFVPVFLFQSLRADEGMWLPTLLEQLNIQDMKSRGFQLTAADIYSVNNGSMKDAVCQFNGGCTAEMISGEGLLLTNHHCGYGQIQQHSSVEHNYIEQGFWAMNRSEEKPCPGATAAFIIRMDDVTAMVLQGVSPSASEKSRDSIIDLNSKALEKKMTEGTHYDAFVRGFMSGNQYFLFLVETFKDVRLVGAPPVSIGNFGGDYDNWIWPRHTGDFSMFRVYANKDNRPAEYSPDNVPYQPRRFFPISLKGVKEKDFTMVYGFPGRTTEYLTSGGVNLIQNVSDPVKVDLRTTRLRIMEEEMDKSELVRIQYAAKHNGVSNAWKKWKGEMLGLRINDAVGKKQEYEREFSAQLDANSAAKNKYGTVLASLQQNYTAIEPYQKAVDYMNEGLLSIEMIRYAEGFRNLVELSKKEKPDTAKINKTVRALRKGAEGWFKDYDVTTDKRIAVTVFQAVEKGIGMGNEMLPPVMRGIGRKETDYAVYLGGIYAKTIFTDKKKVLDLLSKWSASSWKKIEKDPGYMLSQELYSHFRTQVVPNYNKYNNEITRLNRLYMKAQTEVMKNKKFYPDANSTLRVAYGNVEGYSARDGIIYNWYTTIDGIMDKDDPAVYEYHVPAKLKELHKAGDYGNYADAADKKLHTCFIATNHTTGGNSGSPVIDAQGNLIGTNFDRVWEGTMSDVMFDPTRCRNIAVDIRYTLFIIDKFAGAGYLLREMNIIK
ncbi:MAG: dipeptidyl-peptidase 7 [Bacteroidetes bacterium]|nr:MAG: dipeptidyl-peptidase 7 [Bacteroidota bacterium]